MTKNNRKISRNGFRLGFLVAILALSLVWSQKSYSGEQLKFYDTVGSTTDYRGVRTFSKEIRDTTLFMTNGWNYYIVYYKGKKISRYQFLINGNIQFEDRYVYKGNNLVKIKTYRKNSLVATTFLGNDPLKVKTAYQRDRSYLLMHYSNNKMLKRVEKYNSSRKLVTFTKFDYNSMGLQKKLAYYDGNNRLLAYKKFFYNGNLKVKTQDYTSRRKLRGFTKYFYDHSNKLISAKRFNPKGKLMGSSEYEYDDRGMLRYTLYYDNKGRLVVR